MNRADRWLCLCLALACESGAVGDDVTRNAASASGAGAGGKPGTPKNVFIPTPASADEELPPRSPDLRVVRGILDENSFREVPVAKVVKLEGDRVVELRLIGGGSSAKNLPANLSVVPEVIGQLTALKKLEIGSQYQEALPAPLSQLTLLEVLKLKNDDLRQI